MISDGCEEWVLSTVQRRLSYTLLQMFRAYRLHFHHHFVKVDDKLAQVPATAAIIADWRLVTPVATLLLGCIRLRRLLVDTAEFDEILFMWKSRDVRRATKIALTSHQSSDVAAIAELDTVVNWRNKIPSLHSKCRRCSCRYSSAQLQANGVVSYL